MSVERRVTGFYCASSDGERRRHERQNVVHQVRILKRGQAYSAVLVDIGVDGVSFTSFAPFTVGNTVLIALQPDEFTSATVVWDNGVRTGCEFEQPISAEIVQRIAGQY